MRRKRRQGERDLAPQTINPGAATDMVSKQTQYSVFQMGRTSILYKRIRTSLDLNDIVLPIKPRALLASEYAY